jgi:thioredoxin 1
MQGNFNKLIDSEIPVLIDFHAEWCGPCKMQSPIVTQVAKELGTKVKVVKIDVDKNQAIASRFNIRGVPTIMIFKEGKIMYQQAGLTDKNRLIGLLEQYIL